jgi:phosphoglycolate phosphatase
MQLFFDFDGTLVDSAPGIYASFQSTCTRLNLQAPPFDIFRNSIGPPVQLLARRFFPDLKEPELEEFRLSFRNDYDNNRFRQCSWYDGAKSTIETLAAAPKARLSIVTNKPTHPTLELLTSCGLLGCFELVIGIDYQLWNGSGPAFTSKTEALNLAYSHMEPKSSPSFYIGDTPSDREASQACGLRFVAATYGFHRWNHRELSTTSYISAITELIPLLRNATGSGAVYTS